MGYLNTCVVKPKNCGELATELERMGLNPMYKIIPATSDVKDAVLCDKGNIYLIKDYDRDGFSRKMEEDKLDWIQCGDNEELFKALAAVRDDIDRNQWFVYDSMDCSVEELRLYDWFICSLDSIEDELYYDLMFLSTHKASNEEIFEHFK